jgi:hypothetical protein
MAGDRPAATFALMFGEIGASVSYGVKRSM